MLKIQLKTIFSDVKNSDKISSSSSNPGEISPDSKNSPPTNSLEIQTPNLFISYSQPVLRMEGSAERSLAMTVFPELRLPRLLSESRNDAELRSPGIKRFFEKYSDTLTSIGKKIVSSQLILAILVEFVFTPAFFDIFADPFGEAFKTNTKPRGRLENYYNSGDRVKEESEWDRITKSGKEVLSAEWEAKASIEIEDRIKIKTPSEDEATIRGELEVQKSLAKADWERELTKEIDEKKGSWKAKINSLALNDLLKNIDVKSLVQAVLDADALQKNTAGTAQDKIVAWDSLTKDKASLLRADWETQLSQQITNIKGSVVTLSADEKASFETELGKIEGQFQARYKLEESGIVNMARQSLVMNLNDEADLAGAIAQETDPSKLVALLIAKTQKNIDDNGDLKAEITQAYQNVPANYDGISGDPNTKVQRALENGQKLWQKAIDDLLVQKLKFDKDAANKKGAGEDQWSQAYFQLLKERENWSSKINTQIQEGLKNWNDSETTMKENKEKALTELNRYIETSNVQWQSHVRGLEQVVVGSADTLHMIEDNISWFKDAISKLDGATGGAATSAMGVYQGQLADWQEMKVKFQALIIKTQNEVHDKDMRDNAYGVFPATGNQGVLTLAEYNLKIAKIELDSLQKKRDRAKEVYDYAQANSKKTKEEIATELAAYKTDYEAKEKTYTDLLAALNGGGAVTAGSVGSDPNSTTTGQATTPPAVTSLSKLEEKNKELEAKRKELELVRADLDTSRENYENVLKLQVYVHNPGLLTTEIGLVSAIDGGTTDSGLRSEIYTASENVELAKIKIRQQEKLVYETMYEQENARRSREYYQSLNGRILDFEKTKDDKKRLHDALDGNGEIGTKIDSLLTSGIIAKTYSSEESSRIMSELSLLKDDLTNLDNPMKTSVTDFNAKLQPIADAQLLFTAKFTSLEKDKYANYLSEMSSVFDRLKAVPGVESKYLNEEDLTTSKAYYQQMLDGWGDLQSSLNSEFSNFQSVLNSYKAYTVANVGNEETQAYQNEIFEMTMATQKYLVKVGEAENYFKNIGKSFSALDSMVLDSFQRSNVMIDSSLSGTARTDAQNNAKGLNTEYKALQSAYSSVNGEVSQGLNGVTSQIQNYAAVYSNFLSAKADRTGKLEQVSGYVLNLVQAMDGKLATQEYQMEFLLNENGNADTLDEISKKSALEARKTGALWNKLAMEKLSGLISGLGEGERSYDIVYSSVIGEYSDKLKNLKTDADSQTAIVVLSMMKDYLIQNRVAMTNTLVLPEVEYTKFLAALDKEKINADDTLSFFNSSGELTDPEKESIKENGSDKDKRKLSDFYNFGSTFFFRDQLGPFLSSKLDVAANIKVFGEKIKGGEILSVLKDAYFQNQENKSTGLIKEIRDFVPGLKDFHSQDFYQDSSKDPVSLEKDMVEMDLRKGVLSSILSQDLNSRIATLSDVNKLIDIFGNKEAGRVNTDLSNQVSLWNQSKKLADDLGENVKNSVEKINTQYGSYASMFSSTNRDVFGTFSSTLNATANLKNQDDADKPIFQMVADQLGRQPGDPMYQNTYIDTDGKFSFQSGYDATKKINVLVVDQSGRQPGDLLYVDTYLDTNGKYSWQSYDANKKVISGYEKTLSGLDYSYFNNSKTDFQNTLQNWDSTEAKLKNAFNAFQTKAADLLAYALANPDSYRGSADFQSKLEDMQDEIADLATAHSESIDYTKNLVNQFNMVKTAKEVLIRDSKTALGFAIEKKMVLESELGSLPQELQDDITNNPGKYTVVLDSQKNILKLLAKEDQENLTATEKYSSTGKATISEIASKTSEELDKTNSELSSIKSKSEYYVEKNKIRDQKIPDIQTVFDGLADRITVYKSGSQKNVIGQDDVVSYVKGLREFLLEKTFKGDDVNPSVFKALQEVELFTNEMENLKYIQTNPPSNASIAASNTALEDARKYKELMVDSRNLFGQAESLLGSFDQNGIPAYQSPEAVDAILKKYNEIKTKMQGTNFSFSSQVEDAMEELKAHAWTGYIKQIAISFLSGQTRSSAGQEFDTLTQYIEGLKTGKYVILGGNGKSFEKDAKFLGQALTDPQLDEIYDYLKVYDEKARISNSGMIADLEGYLETQDPELKAELKDQVLFTSYRTINQIIDSGSFPDLSQAPDELKSFAIVRTFLGYLNNMRDDEGNKKFIPSDANSREAAKNELIINLGVGGEAYLPVLNEFLSNYSTRNESYYLDQKLKELSAIEKYIYRTNTENVKPGDMAKLTEWIVAEKYETSVETAMKSAVRMDFILKNYYGEKRDDYIAEMDKKLKILDNDNGLTSAEKNLFLLTNAGFSPGSYFSGILGYMENPIQSIQANFFLDNFQYTNKFEKLQKDMHSESLKLEKEILNAESKERKEKYVNDVKNGLITISSYESYLNIPKAGQAEPTQAMHITNRLSELEKHAELKMGAFLSLLETYNSNAFLTPTGDPTNKNDLSLSIQKTLKEVNKVYDYTKDNDLDLVKNDGTYVFQDALDTQVLDKLVNYVGATDVNYQDNSPFSITQAAYGEWSGIKETIRIAGQRVSMLAGLVGTALETSLSNMGTIFKSIEAKFATKQTEFDTAKAAQEAEVNNYTAKQKETSDAYNAMLGAEKLFSNSGAIYDYAAMLEYSKHETTQLDGNGKPIVDTTIASPLALAQKRYQDADKELSDQQKKVNDLQKIKQDQVTLLELQNNTQIQNQKKVVEEWAMRAMRFSEAEKLIRNEITDLRTKLNTSRGELSTQIGGLLDVKAGSYGANLESYNDYYSTNYKNSQKALNEMYFYADMFFDPSTPITADHYIAKSLSSLYMNDIQNQLGGKTVFKNVDSKNTQGYNSLWTVIKTDTPITKTGTGTGNTMGGIETLINGLPPIGGLLRTGNLNAWTARFGENGKGAAEIIQENKNSTDFGYLIYAVQYCNINPICWFGVATLANDTKKDASGSLAKVEDAFKTQKNDLKIKLDNFRNDTARLNKLTQITDAQGLMDVLKDPAFKLQAADIEFLKNTNSGSLDGLQWDLGEGSPLALNQLVGANGESVIQYKVRKDKNGLVERNQDGTVVTARMMSANEVSGTLAMLAETKYSVERDVYFNETKDFETRGSKVDMKNVLDERESFYYQLINQASGVGSGNKMYKRLVRDYMGSDLAESGANTVTNGLSIVDEAMLLKNSQIKEAELKIWSEKEKEFYQKKKEWMENVEFLKKTGDDRFKSITTEFTNSWNTWRVDTDKKIKTESDKYTGKIATAFNEQKNWTANFLAKSQEADAELSLQQMYDSITTQVTEMKQGLPGNIQLDNIDVNAILQKYATNKPKDLEAAMFEAGKNVNVDFFLNKVSNRAYDTKIQDEYAALQGELKRKAEVMVRLQNVLDLFTMKDTFGEIIRQANAGTKSYLDQIMSANGWGATGTGYMKLSAKNIPVTIEGYKEYTYDPIQIPKVKDASGKEWNLLETEKLIAANGPSGVELSAMVKVVTESMQKDFEKQYNPDKKETYEQPSNYSLMRQNRAYQQWQATNDNKNFSWDIKEFFLVGKVEGGAFGKNHHDEFWRILTTMDNVGFLEDAYSNRQQLRAQQRAHREQIQDTVVAAAAVATNLIPGCQFWCAVGVYGAYSAYKAERAYQKGGERGAELSLVSSGINAFAGDAGVTVNLSYTYQDGYGASVGIGGPMTDGAGNFGISYSEKDGFGVSAGINVGGGVNVGINLSERGRSGLSVGYQQTTDGKANGFGFKVGYSWDKDGKNGGLNAQATVTGQGSFKPNDNGGEFTSVTGGLTFDSKNGFGVTASTQGRNDVFDIAGNLAWSQNGGFNGSYELSRNWSRYNLEKMNPDDQRRTLISAQEKMRKGEKLNDVEQAAYDGWKTEAMKDVSEKEMNDMLLGVSRVAIRDEEEEKKNEEIRQKLLRDGRAFDERTGKLWTLDADGVMKAYYKDETGQTFQEIFDKNGNSEKSPYYRINTANMDGSEDIEMILTAAGRSTTGKEAEYFKQKKKEYIDGISDPTEKLQALYVLGKTKDAQDFIKTFSGQQRDDLNASLKVMQAQWNLNESVNPLANEKLKDHLENQVRGIDPNDRLGSAIKFLEANKQAYLKDSAGKTYCNVLVGDYVTAFGAPNLQNYLGEEHLINDIVDRLKAGAYNDDKSDYEFVKATDKEAEQYAASGGLALAAWKNPTGGHGHVAAITGGYVDDKNNPITNPADQTVNNLKIFQAGEKFGEMNIDTGFSGVNKNRLDYYIWRKK